MFGDCAWNEDALQTLIPVEQFEEIAVSEGRELGAPCVLS